MECYNECFAQDCHNFIGLLRGGSLMFPKVPQSSLGILRVPQLSIVEPAQPSEFPIITMAKVLSKAAKQTGHDETNKKIQKNDNISEGPSTLTQSYVSPRNKGLIAGLIKGNQWLINFLGGVALGGYLRFP